MVSTCNNLLLLKAGSILKTIDIFSTRSYYKPYRLYLLYYCFAFFFSTFGLKAQEEFQVFRTTNGNSPVWEGYKDAPYYLYYHLSNEAFELLDKREKRIHNIHTPEEWREYQDKVKDKLKKVIGPFPARTPLNAKILRTIEKEGYKVEHIVFESIPGYRITSSMFIPSDSKRKKAPAILYCSGHSRTGYRTDGYQFPILNLVKKGFVVFAFDPVGQGERIQYYNRVTKGSEFDHPVDEHSYPGAQAFLTGSSVAKYFIWDGIRALDYLVTRKEVDPSRIGVTGRSGGGTQSAYIAALDDRIHAAAPECWVTNYRRIIQSIGPQDGEQNLYHFIYEGLDIPDFLIARAPKPAMMITTTNDFFSIQGAIETEKEVSRVYKAFGKSKHFQRVEDFGVHQNTKQNREAMYAFFQEHLDNPGNSGDENINFLTEEELKVTSSGQLATSLGSETLFSLNKNETEKLETKLNSSRADIKTHLSSTLISARKISRYKEPESIENPVLTGKYKKEGYIIEKGFLQGQGDYVIPFVYFIPEGDINNIMLYLHPNGKMADPASHKEIEWFTEQGFVVLAPDLLGTGETYPIDYVGDAYIDNVSLNIWFTSTLVNKSIAGIRGEDVSRLARLAERRFGEKTIYALAKEEMAPVLLHVAAFDDKVQNIALVRPYSSYISIAMNRYYNTKYIFNVVPDRKSVV